MSHSNITKNMRYRERYNTALCRTRVLIEQTYRILKRKFPCFAVSLRTDQGRICQYVVSCMVLNCIGTLRHNIVTLSLDDLRKPHRTSRRLQIQPTTTAFVPESSLSGSVSIIELFL